MPRKKKPVEPSASGGSPETPLPEPVAQWAEPYRPVVSDPASGFELGENKLASIMMFSFARDPGEKVKDRLKHYGYMYNATQKAWSVNATPTTREIARRLAAEFSAGKASDRAAGR
ncbi:MAG TPA: hypothetical protein VHQ47_06145 [Phycisphaerae bacterium]|nr:hypothetical protein [Phycisphaerae bacterium]